MLLVIMSFMVLYVLFLTMVLVVKRYRQRKLRRLLPGQVALPNTLIDNDAWPLISIIVPAYNEASVLPDTIACFMQLTYPNLEILVMNDRSKDNTQAVLESLATQYEGHRVSFRTHTRPPEAVAGKSAVLNDALALSKGDYLCVFDADARVASGFLETLLPLVEPEGVAAAQARKMISNEHANLLTQCQQLEYTFDAHLQQCRDLAGAAVELRGNGQLVKRQCVEAVGGWNEASITDDLDLSTRFHLAGYQLRFTAQAQVFEEGVLQLWPLIKQRCRWAEGSLRRYLSFGRDILFNPNVMLRTRADMLAYLVNFLFPILVAIESSTVLLATFLGYGNLLKLWFSIASVPVFVLLFIPTIYFSLRRFGGFGRIRSAKGAILTGLFMVGVWVPVVFYVFAKVILKPNAPFHWEKTQHGTFDKPTIESTPQ
jgi:1,2-diacylglycerol 3-beta-glucosyltransferase